LTHQVAIPPKLRRAHASDCARRGEKARHLPSPCEIALRTGVVASPAEGALPENGVTRTDVEAAYAVA
jgi:hypothetical protein